MAVCKPLMSGGAAAAAAMDPAMAAQALTALHTDAAEVLGKAVQLDSIKPPLTAPGTKHSKLNCGYTAFNFCFQIQLTPLQLGQMRPEEIAPIFLAAAGLSEKGGAGGGGGGGGGRGGRGDGPDGHDVDPEDSDGSVAAGHSTGRDSLVGDAGSAEHTSGQHADAAVSADESSGHTVERDSLGSADDALVGPGTSCPPCHRHAARALLHSFAPSISRRLTAPHFQGFGSTFIVSRRSYTCGHVFHTCVHDFRRDSRKYSRVSI